MDFLHMRRRYPCPPSQPAAHNPHRMPPGHQAGTRRQRLLPIPVPSRLSLQAEAPPPAEFHQILPARRSDPLPAHSCALRLPPAPSATFPSREIRNQLELPKRAELVLPPHPLSRRSTPRSRSEEH